MIKVSWTTAEGVAGDVLLEGDDKWTFGRGAEADPPTVSIDHPLVSRVALVIRDAGPGPVVFRGQRDNGATVALVDSAGTTTWIEEGTAGNLSVDASHIEFSLEDRILLTIDVEFDPRGSVIQRQRSRI